MRKTLIAAVLCVLSTSAMADRISEAAGVCGAYHLLVKNDVRRAEWAMNHSVHRGRMQIAARQWTDLAKSDPRSAYRQAGSACIITLKMKDFK